MFRHQGKSRTLKHNLLLAAVLSFVAGIVNVTGFLAFNQLTTNVTGHFALFINDVANFKAWKGSVYFLYILSFLFGAFTSGYLIEKYQQNKKLNIFLVPVLIECIILVSIAVVGIFYHIEFSDLIVCMLLFSMGLQNSLVTRISDAIVRTTHLTGLFTDLGIELAQLFFPRTHPFRQKLISTIKLRLYIITFFFIGGFTGGFLFSELDLKLSTLLLPAFILMLSLFYDDLRFGLIKSKRRYKYRAKKPE